MIVLILTYMDVDSCTIGPVGRNGVVTKRIVIGNARRDVPFTAIVVLKAGHNTISGRRKRFRFHGLTTNGCALHMRIVKCGARRGAVAIDTRTASMIRFRVRRMDFAASRIIISTGQGRIDQGTTPIIMGIVDTGLFRAIGSASLTGSLGFRSNLQIRGGYRGYNFPRIHVGKLRNPCSRVLVGDHPVVDTLSKICKLRRVPMGVVRHIRIMHNNNSTLFNTGTMKKAVGVVAGSPVGGSFRITDAVSGVGNGS